jgi:hypothetical protein
MWFNTHKNLAIAIIIGVTSLALVFVAIVPIYQSASTILADIGKKSTELDALSDKVAVLTMLDANILEERVTVIDKALPPKKDVLLYLNAVDGLARELGLTFGGLSLSPGEVTEATGSAKKTAKSSGGLQALETELKMSGGRDSVYAFLRTIEEVLPLMQIKNVKVTVTGVDNYSLALTLAMLWAEPATADVKSKITLFSETEEKYFTQLSGYRRFEGVISTGANPEIKQDLFKPQQ